MPNPLHVLEEDNVSFINQEEVLAELERIRKTKIRKLRKHTVYKVLIQLKGFSKEEASWEDWDQPVNQFPHLKQWDLS